MHVRILRIALLLVAGGAVGYLLAPRRPRPTGPSQEFRGNDATRVFHDPSCRYADAADTTFESRDDALAAGYEACKVCTP